MRTRTAVAVAAVVVTLAGCSANAAGTSPTPTSAPVDPEVTLHVPETTTADGLVDLVVDSAGHDGETAQLYAFRAYYDEVSDCSDTEVKPMPVTLNGGPQKVTVSTGQEGDLWFVLTGDGFGTECAASGSRLRVLIDPAPELADLPAQQVGVEFTYGVRANVSDRADAPPLEASVQWVGPFATVPDARASGCPTEPVDSLDEAELLSTEDGYAEFTKSVSKAGVYRLLLTIPATEYTAAYEPACEDAPLITVR